MAKILVVGGAGYIGSHACKALKKAGHSTLVFDDLSTGFRELVKFSDFQKGSILQVKEIEDAVKKMQPDAVMHFAAKAAVGESVINPAFYYEQNIIGSYNLLECLRKFAPHSKFIFSSTCAVYGEFAVAISEDTPLKPVNPYGRTKRMIEEMLADYDQAYGVKSVCLRYFNAAGADSDGEVGEMHHPETHLIPRILNRCKNPQAEETKIFGNDYSTPDGTCIRDYIHVEDLANAHLKAMEYLLSGGSSEIYNLGSAKGSSVLEVVRMIEKVTSTKLSLAVVGRRAGDPARLVASSAKFQKQFSWKPEHDLESIIQSAWKWTKDRP